MAISDVYNARASNTFTTSAAAFHMGVWGSASKRIWVVGCRMEIQSAGSTPAGNQVLFQLARSGNSCNTASGSATITPVAQDAAAPAALASAFSATTGMTTAPTLGNVVAEWTLPQTSGSSWEEFPPTGYEWGCPVGLSGSATGLSLWVTPSNTTSTVIVAELVWSE